jgi:hypothetical protein
MVYILLIEVKHLKRNRCMTRRFGLMPALHVCDQR